MIWYRKIPVSRDIFCYSEAKLLRLTFKLARSHDEQNVDLTNMYIHRYQISPYRSLFAINMHIFSWLLLLMGGVGKKAARVSRMGCSATVALTRSPTRSCTANSTPNGTVTNTVLSCVSLYYSEHDVLQW